LAICGPTAVDLDFCTGGTLLEPITPHGMRAGFITMAYRNGVPDEEIMGHTRHRSLPTMRGYIRRGKLGKDSPAGKLGL
jgi:integrase